MHFSVFHITSIKAQKLLKLKSYVLFALLGATRELPLSGKLEKKVITGISIVKVSQINFLAHRIELFYRNEKTPCPPSLFLPNPTTAPPVLFRFCRSESSYSSYQFIFLSETLSLSISPTLNLIPFQPVSPDPINPFLNSFSNPPYIAPFLSLKMKVGKKKSVVAKRYPIRHN
jgi:hypothetical protein